MRRLVVLPVLMCGLVTPPPAIAEEERPLTYGVHWKSQADDRCGFASAGTWDQTGYVQGGPIVAALYGAPSVSITCTIQVGALGSVHAGPDAARETQASSTVAVIAPRPVTFVAPWGSDTWLCTEIMIGNVRHYWHDAGTGGTSGYTTSSSARCELAGTQDVLPFENDVVIETMSFVDFLVCPALASVLPPDGDIPGAWDCPPYGN